MHPPRSVSSGALRRVLLTLVCGLGLLAALTTRAQGITKRAFDLPLDTAEKTLKLYSQQSGRALIMGSTAVQGVRTNQVRGEFTPREALDLMLANTGLEVVEDAKSGSLGVRKAAAPNGERAAPPTRGDRPSQNRPSSAADLPALSRDVVQVLSPFEVKSDSRGYFASNAMSGTRLNTKIEDLASSISVVTKEQMLDFAMLDINDIFNYEASTEGTGNYTAFNYDSSGQVTDEVQDDPQNANRVRGMGRANIALNNFATSGRVPVDPINIDAVEISRGPNSNIFGLGGGAGTVNMVAASANISRPFATASLRFDNVGGSRRALDLNRPILNDKLALRVSAVLQHDGSNQKPTGFDTRRFNVMVRAQPFKTTTVRGSYQNYRGVGNRPNAASLRDGVTYWQGLGSPTWDPVEQTMTVNGVTRFFGANNPTNLASANNNYNGGAIYVEPNQGIALWMIKRTPAAGNATGPLNVNGPIRIMASPIENIRANHPLFATQRPLASKALFDYNRVNLAAPNWLQDTSEISSVSIDQFALDREQHKLAFQYAWQREDSDRNNRNIIGKTLQSGNTNFLFVDVNSRLLDGRPNPYFLRPFIEAAVPNTVMTTFRRDTHRGQGVYALDLSRSTSWLRWLGRHQLIGYYERRKTATNTFRFGDSMISDHPIYARPGTPRQGTGTPIAVQASYRYYVGDGQGQNVDYAPGTAAHGTYTFNWFDAVASRWVADPATLGDSLRTPLSGGRTGSLILIKTKGAVVQSSLLANRLVFTAGIRTDDSKNKYARPGATDPINLWQVDYAAMDGYVGDWESRTGDTTTYGAVARPFRGWQSINRQRARGGLAGIAGEVLAGLQLHYNRSESFAPAEKAINILLEDLGNPTSSQTEYGFSLSLWEKVSLRVNHYETKEKNSRRGGVAELGTRMRRIDFAFATPQSPGGVFNLQQQATDWVMAANPSWTAGQVATRVAEIMQVDPGILDVLNSNIVAETSDIEGKGEEYELHFNPTRYWTLRINAARQETSERSIARGVATWVEKRLPVWESIIDPRTNTPWFTTPYGSGNDTARNSFIASVRTELELNRATEGLARPQIREWRANLSTNYRLAGLSTNPHLRRTNVGGAIRWEDKGAIGYYGFPVNGDIAAAVSYDRTRPVFDKAHTYIDAFVGYSTRFLGDKIRARFQMNVRNIQEDGRLQPVGAYPTGEPHTYRIINPRTFIFTATFDL